MLRPARLLALLCTLVVPVAALGASGSASSPGTWRPIATAPAAVFPGTSVWTGKRLFVFGNVPNTSVDVTAAYDPAANTWTRLVDPGTSVREPAYKALWTGKEILVWAAFRSQAFDPRTKEWRTLPRPLPLGVVVWTGREAIGWGGGCCGDARADGAAYNPATRRFRKLPRSPLAPSQSPLGVWNGRELLIFVSGFDPEGKPWPARFARAAAYDPAKNTWRRIAALPVAGPRLAGGAVWDGREVLIAAAGARARAAFAFAPATNRWRRLAPLPAGRVGATAVWTGTRLFLWGGQNASASANLPGGLAYDPRVNSWTSLRAAPLRARTDAIVAWTGKGLVVWGGEIGTPAGTRIAPTFPRDGAIFTPATR